MKTVLACLLVLAIGMPLSNASCFIWPFKPGLSDGGIIGCLDSDAKLYEFDSQWKTDNCYDCSCSRNGIRCCTSFMKSTGYDKKKCVSIFNKMTCTYKAVEKDNNSKECPVFDWVG